MARLIKWVNDPYTTIHPQNNQPMINLGGTITLDFDEILGVQEICDAETGELTDMAFLMRGLGSPVLFSNAHARKAREMWIEHTPQLAVGDLKELPVPQPSIKQEAMKQKALIQTVGPKA